MTVHDVIQRSPEWHTLRLGRLCGSRAADMLATVKDPKKEAAGRRNLRIQLVLERITGHSQENGYISAAMQQGIDREADATALYEGLTGRLLRTVGYVSHDALMAGCSPDGAVGDFEGIIEAKSPIAATHWDYLRSGRVPDEYLKQILHNLWITGAQWCDWLSYQPDFPPPLQVKLVRVPRDEALIASYELMARQFLSEVDRDLDELRRLAETPLEVC